MIKYPENLQRLIESFKKYPGIGPKNAERLAFHTIMNLNKEDATSFSNNIINAINNIKKCTCNHNSLMGNLKSITLKTTLSTS